MAENTKYVSPLSERITVACLVTLGVAYVAFLGLDLMNGWGLGWVVIGYIAGAGGIAAGLAILVHVWRWVYRGTGKYQMKKWGK